MFKHVDAVDQLRRLGWAIFREYRIVGKIFKIPLTEFMQCAPQVALARAVIGNRPDSQLFDDLFDDWSVAERYHAVIRILMQLSLLGKIIIGNRCLVDHGVVTSGVYRALSYG